MLPTDRATTIVKKVTSDLEVKEDQDVKMKAEYSVAHVNPGAYYNEALIVKVWEAHIHTAKLKYYYWVEGEDEVIVDTIFANKDSVSLNKNAGLLVKADGKLYKRKDTVGDKEKSVSICNLVNHRPDSRPGLRGFNAITFNLKIALSQLIHWNKDKNKERITMHVIIFPYHATEYHWNLGVLELNIDTVGQVNPEIRTLDPLGGGTLSSFVLEAIEGLLTELFKNVKKLQYAAQSCIEHPKQQNDGAACGPITAENGRDFIDGTTKRLMKNYPPQAKDLRLQHLVEVQCDSFQKEQWSDDRQYTDSAIKGDKGAIDKHLIIEKLIKLINQLGEEHRQEFYQAFEVLAEVCREERGSFVQMLDNLREKEILNDLNEQEKSQIARLCLDEVYVKHKLGELISDPYIWPTRKLKSLILAHKKEFMEAELFEKIIVEHNKFANGVRSLFEEVAKKNKNQIKINKQNLGKGSKAKKPKAKPSENITLFSSYSGFVSALSTIDISESADGNLIFESTDENDITRLIERIRSEWLDNTNGLGKYIKKDEALTNVRLNVSCEKIKNDKNIIFRYSLSAKLIKIFLEAINKFYNELEKQKRDKNRNLPLGEKSASLVGSGGHPAAGLKNTFHGNIYQLKLLMLFLKKGIEHHYSFTLATEMIEAEKFDDLIFKYSVDKGEYSDDRAKKAKSSIYKYRYLQAKHKLSDKEKIKDSDLLTEDDKDFSLQKYFLSFCNIKKRIKDGALEDFTICTNINFDFAGDANSDRILKLKEAFKILKEDDILNVSGKRKAIRYRFKTDFPGKKELFKVFRKTSDLNRLVKVVVNYAFGAKNFELRGLLKEYHVALSNEILDVESGRFSKSFIENSKKLSEQAKKFREIFIKKALKYIKDEQDEEISEEQMLKKVSKMNLSFSQTFSNKGGGQTKLPDDEVSDEHMNEFLERLVFAVNQPNEKELGVIIEERIGKEFNLIDDDLIANKFQKEMLDWMKDKKGLFLSSKEGEQFFIEARHKIDRLILLGPTLEYGGRLEKFNVGFKPIIKLQNFLNLDHGGNIFCFTAEKNTYISCIKVYQTLKTVKKYQTDGSYIFIRLSSAMNMIERLDNAFKAKKCDLLVIDIDIESKKFKKLFEKIQEILVKNAQKKIIIVTNKSNPIHFELISPLNTITILDSYNNYSDLDTKTQSALKEKRVIFQGQQMSLGELTEEDTLQELIKEDTLHALIANDEIVVDEKPYSLSAFEDSCYIDRTIKYKRKILKNCLKENKSDIFFIVGINESALKELIPSNEMLLDYDTEELDTRNPVRYIFLEKRGNSKKDISEKFYRLCHHYSKYTIHWINMEKENLIWMKSRGLLINLTRYMEDEELDEDKLLALDKNVVIVAAEPGMGKSSLVTRLVEKTKKLNPTRWVIRVDLITFREQISEAHFNTTEDAIEFLVMTQKLSIFSKHLFTYRMTVKGQIQLFLDGFDEISSDQQKGILQFIRLLKNVKIFVTTRLHMKAQLADTLGTFACALEPFSKKKRVKFLLKFWLNSLKIDDPDKEESENLEQFAQSLLKVFSESTQDMDLNFMGIPLQARLLAEAFVVDVKKYLNSKEEMLEPPKMLSLTSLYERFVKVKFSIYFKEKVRMGTEFNSVLRSAIEHSLVKAHQYKALDILFPEHIEELFGTKLMPLFTVEELRLAGIIQSIEDVSSFIHRTFAEYYAAEFFVKKLKKGREHPSCKKIKAFLLKHIFKARNFVICTFIEHRIAKEQNAELTQIWLEIKASEVIKDNFIDEFGKLKFVETVQTTEEKNLVEEQDDPLEETPSEEPKKDFTELLAELKKWEGMVKEGHSRVGGKVCTFLSDFFEAFFQVTDIVQLERSLKILHSIADNTDYNNLKNNIVYKLDKLVDHYFRQCILQNEVEINIEILKSFKEIKPQKTWTLHGDKVGDWVAVHLADYEKNLVLYLEVAGFIQEKKKVTVSFLRNLTDAKIMYVRKIKSPLTHDSVKVLKEKYTEWKKNAYFIELFFLIDKKEANNVKSFLIAKHEFHLLIRFAQEFEGLKLTEKEVMEVKRLLIYETDDETNEHKHQQFLDLFKLFPELKLNREEVHKVYRQDGRLIWLERGGISYFNSYELLTAEIAHAFNSILEESRINGYHTRYAINILDDLIFPVLKRMEKDPLPGINRIAFINMSIKFLKFASTHHLRVVLDFRKINSIFVEIKKILSLPIISPHMFSCVVQAMVVLPAILGFKVIDFDKNLLLVNPSNDFCLELSFKRKALLLKWMKIYQEDQEKFTKEMQELTQEILTEALTDLDRTFSETEKSMVIVKKVDSTGLCRSSSQSNLRSLHFSYRAASSDISVAQSKGNRPKSTRN